MIYKHELGKDCNQCCCKFVHHENCGGNIHSELVADSVEDGYVHNLKCDKCNVEEYVPGYEDHKIVFFSWSN